MSQKYDIKINGIYKNEAIIIFRWDAIDIGFGELVIDAKTHAIIDDEYMSKEFCDEVIRLGFIVLNAESQEELKDAY